MPHRNSLISDFLRLCVNNKEEVYNLEANNSKLESGSVWKNIFSS